MFSTLFIRSVINCSKTCCAETMYKSRIYADAKGGKVYKNESKNN